MPAQADTRGGVVHLPTDYQTQGAPDMRSLGSPEWDPNSEAAEEFAAAAEVEQLGVATLENWLLDDTPIEEWVPLRTRNLRVKLRALTEEVRSDIEKRAPRKMNKQTKRPEADQSWINLELVRCALVEPQVPNPELLKKALAGELAYLAQEIGRISGFDFQEGDALG